MDEKNMNNQVIEEDVTDINNFIEWVKSHKKQLIIIGVSIPTFLAIVLGVKNEYVLKKVWKDLQDEMKEASLYCRKWFEMATDDELDIEREKVRLACCSSGENLDLAVQLQNMLWRFDKEISERAWGSEKPYAPSIHREHGWYLSNDV